MQKYYFFSILFTLLYFFFKRDVVYRHCHGNAVSRRVESFSWLANHFVKKQTKPVGNGTEREGRICYPRDQKRGTKRMRRVRHSRRPMSIRRVQMSLPTVVNPT